MAFLYNTLIINNHLSWTVKMFTCNFHALQDEAFVIYLHTDYLFFLLSASTHEIEKIAGPELTKVEH